MGDHRGIFLRSASLPGHSIRYQTGDTMPKILFVAAHRPDRSPCQRYRFEQFFPYWEKHGFSCDQVWIIDEADDAAFYSPGNLIAKSRIFLKSHKLRQEQVARAGNYDIIFLQREAFMTGSTRFERELAAIGVPMIYDIDDAIWLMDVSDGNRKLKWMKDPAKVQRIIPLAQVVLAGNQYLADYASQFNRNVQVVPTVIDTERYVEQAGQPAKDSVLIGWTGSQTSMTHLEPMLPLLRQMQERFGSRISFRIISDRKLEDAGLDLEYRPWRSSTEPEDLADIDIGIMPLPMNEWSKGKCGFKGLQYMGLGKAVVLQDHGVNPTIVQLGVNGLLATSNEDWDRALTMLIEDAALRNRLGAAARQTVVDHYSVQAWRDHYLQLFRNLIKDQPTHARTQDHHALPHP